MIGGIYRQLEVRNMQVDHRETGEAPRTTSVACNVIRGSLGNLIEWYDWYAYAAFSIYFASVFFPSGNQTAQLLNTAGIFAVDFLVWPLGGWMFGRYADRFGRRLKCANRSRSLRTLWSSQESTSQAGRQPPRPSRSAQPCWRW